MDKIHINLSPKKEKIDNVLFQNLTYYLVLAAIFILGVIVLLGFFLVVRAGVCKHYEARWSKWKKQYAALSVIKKDLNSLQNEKKEFSKILTPETEMAKLLKDIFNSLSQNIWFENLNFKKNSLDIKGDVVRIDEDYLVSLEKFINNLKAKDYFVSHFKKINIKGSQRKLFNGLEVLEFDLECVK